MILAIETSCDETAAAVTKGNRVLSSVISSQVKLHSKYGGVVPEVAARAHIESMILVIKEALSRAKVKLGGIREIAVVNGPGLLPSLLIGVQTAKSLSFALQKPLIPIHHIEGHVYANWIGKTSKSIPFPALCLVVSGGHTELLLMRGHMRFKKIGATQDDAAGEAFDKVANLLGLGYPGGPMVSKFAEKGDRKAFDFPRPMFDSENFDFSFSGLKTAVMLEVRAFKKKTPEFVRNICASFEQAAVDVLVFKTSEAIKKFKVKSVLLAGGVAANKHLRRALSKELSCKFPRVKYFQPDLKYCVDNAAMIGVAAGYKRSIKKQKQFFEIEVEENEEL